jgi:hypothetical protein
MGNDIAIGPFIGSFESEIILFQPYVKWLMSVLKPDNVYVSSHKNRKFLYPKNVTFFPVYEDLTRNEFNQDKVVHKDVNGRDYNIIIKKFKQDVQSKDVFYYNVPYSKHAWIPEYKRIFEPIEHRPVKDSKIIFIPSDMEKSVTLDMIYKKLLSSCDGLGVVCDMKSHLPAHNILLRDPMYFANVYRNMIDNIAGARCVICPSSHWTYICDLFNIPSFSWGRYECLITINNNRKSVILNNDDMTVECIISRMEKWLEAHHFNMNKK